ncbi:(2Fe-2S) ferredoxin domain-containing protein [Tumidithrix helvetica]|uniref:(2Fe-2S) ferredoxin domain-containing protein n=1 Tax=Tumidithrix helvetica TaxID=3457545 RepID=UPI003CC5AC01
MQRQVLVCQYRTCKKDGSANVLKVFQAEPIPNVTVSACGCLGLCGSGPIVVVLPDNIYYWHVQPKEVAQLVEKHLLNDQPLCTMMHPRLHPNPSQFLP